MKTSYIILFLLIVGGITVLTINNYSKIDCSKGYGAVFLKESEKSLASTTGRGNIVAVIVSEKEDESNSLIFEKELSKCGFDFSNLLYTNPQKT